MLALANVQEFYISRPLIAIVEGALLFPPSANTWIIGGRDNYTAPAPMGGAAKAESRALFFPIQM